MRRRGVVWLAWGICGIPLVVAALIWLLYTKNGIVALPPERELGFGSPLFDAGVLLASAFHGMWVGDASDYARSPLSRENAAV